jgi:hypothetical protein
LPFGSSAENTITPKARSWSMPWLLSALLRDLNALRRCLGVTMYFVLAYSLYHTLSSAAEQPYPPVTGKIKRLRTGCVQRGEPEGWGLLAALRSTDLPGLASPDTWGQVREMALHGNAENLLGEWVILAHAGAGEGGGLDSLPQRQPCALFRLPAARPRHSTGGRGTT